MTVAERMMAHLARTGNAPLTEEGLAEAVDDSGRTVHAVLHERNRGRFVQVRGTGT